MHRNTEARIDLQAIRSNLALVRELAPESLTVAVIKANAYGHGLVPVARVLEDDAELLAVAFIDEAVELREAGVGGPVLVLEGVSSREAWREAAAQELTVVVNDPAQVAKLRGAGIERQLPVWVKVDTGMHRLGFEPGDVDAVLEELQALGAKVEVLCTHLARADEADGAATQRQIELFRGCAAGRWLPLGRPDRAGLTRRPIPLSIANSAGILARPDSHADLVRPGYMLYGNSPLTTQTVATQRLQPAMTFVSELIAIRHIEAGEAVGYGGRWVASRPSVIGTIAAGYADGYPRHAPDGTPILVGGHLCPLAGTVSMDMITVDLTEHPGAAVGEAVELWGRNVAVNDVAARAGAIGYELLTRVSARVPRRYTGS